MGSKQLGSKFLKRSQISSHTPSALDAGAKRSGATCHMAMPQSCYLAKGAKWPSHTTNTIKFDRIPFDPCNSNKSFELCPFDQKNSTYLQPPLSWSQPHQRRSRWRHHDTLDKRSCCLVDERMTSPLFWSSSKQESMPWDFLTAFWTESKQHLKKMWRRMMNVSSERGKKQIEPNYSTWCGASWFSVLTRQASTSSV